MKLSQRIKLSMEGLIQAIKRYPVTSLFLILAAVVNGFSIQRSGFDQYDRLLAACIIGALLGLAVQSIYERFFTDKTKRWLLAAGAVIITGLYYLTLLRSPDFSLIISVRTTVLVFALIVGFIWIPTIQSRFHLDQSFLIVFKGAFTSLFFGAVIMLGVSLIIAATDQLLFDVGYRTYPHGANIIFVLFAPMYFLSLVPNYNAAPGVVEERLQWSRFLEVLVAYIIIPLVTVFTVILVLYIVTNIGDQFWTDNLLEPMLVTYSITVIFVYVLSGTLENKAAYQFHRIFPKVLVPIVLFQTVASALKIQEEGLTHGRYFVILYGIFAIISGVLFSIYKGKKNGMVALLLIVFSIISIMPPVDAFGVSRRSQINQLESALVDNGMLMDGEIQRAGEISEEAQRIISSTTAYIYRMNYTEDISWIPENFDYYSDFEQVFGFTPSGLRGPIDGPVYRSFYRNQEVPMEIGNFDYMIQTAFSTTEGQNAGQESGSRAISFQEEAYTAGWEGTGETKGFYLRDSRDNQVLFIDINEISTRFEEIEAENPEISQQQAAFSVTDNGKHMAVVLNFVDIHYQNDEPALNGDGYILIGDDS